MLLTELLKTNHIKAPVESKNRDDLIAELIEVLGPAVPEKKTVYQAVLEREKIMTTGIGNSIAIPHCKHSSCPDFAIALGIANKGIDFNAIDKNDVNIIFLLIGPDNNPAMHIKLLSRISRLMSNEQLRQQILENSDAENIHTLLLEEEKQFTAL